MTARQQRRWGAAAVGALLAALHLGVAASEAARGCPAEAVRIALPDLPAGEFLKGKGDRFASPDPGHLVRELREVEQRLGCRFELVRLPVVRMVREASAGQFDLVVPTPEAMALAQGWLLPRSGDRTNLQLAVGHSSLSLFVLSTRADDLRTAWASDGRPKGSVGVVAGSVPAEHAKAAGWSAQTIQDFERGLAMLMLQRVDHVFAPALSLADSEPVRSGEVVALLPPVLPVAYFPAATPAFGQRHPEFLRAFWRAACQASLARRSDRPSCKP
ncbi:hypothetical protein [Inhella crocodyli]|uniref:Transporter substrate-binding domain-containing protein n=1 Tax=Inhella crocodyli TaxID=2499851 RepID=A0A437LHS5_9BURK|nr:hypothetical protein [Inhella crocodyli]RVT84913.1 hypothetical protein EOD73_12380 [Inhella crocodyli]